MRVFIGDQDRLNQPSSDQDSDLPSSDVTSSNNPSAALTGGFGPERGRRTDDRPVPSHPDPNRDASAAQGGLWADLRGAVAPSRLQQALAWTPVVSGREM